MAPLPPRVAVVGGGLTGSLCSLVLRMRGARPVVIDAGRSSLGHSGALPDSGTQFLRAVDPRLQAMLAMLEREGLVAQWAGRFGVLGSSGGGFLPAEVVAATKLGAAKAPNSDGSFSAYTDGGDFCGFINELTSPNSAASAAATYVGMPTMGALCNGILAKANVEVWSGRSVAGASFTPGRDGGWRLELNSTSGSSAVGPEDAGLFDALVLCADDPLLAARVVQGISGDLREVHGSSSGKSSSSSNSGSGEDEWELLAAGRLDELAHDLRALKRRPLLTLSALYPATAESSVPSLDAATIPGSPILQFLARDASKPGRPALRPSWPRSAAAPGDGTSSIAPAAAAPRVEGALWTAVSTAAFAEHVLAQFPALAVAATSNTAAATNAGNSTSTTSGRALAHLREVACNAAVGPMEAELQRLLGLAAAAQAGLASQNASSLASEEALTATATLWPHALQSSKGLGLHEDAIALEPWRLAIAGDFVRTPRQAQASNDPDSHKSDAEAQPPEKEKPPEGPSTPAEASAVSGLEAGERVSAFFAK